MAPMFHPWPRKCTHIRGGFTLIELLIVVGIIAILAAIAVPNLLEAQIRAKTSRVKADLRVLAAAIETYTVDNNHPLYDGEPGQPHYGWVNAYAQATTPVAYLSATPSDTFQDKTVKSYFDPPPGQTYYTDHPTDTKHAYDYGTAYWHSVGADQQATDYWIERLGNSAWKIGSCGPDQRFQTASGVFGGGNRYDPTNGTISEGDIYRTQVMTP